MNFPVGFSALPQVRFASSQPKKEIDETSSSAASAEETGERFCRNNEFVGRKPTPEEEKDPAQNLW